MLNFIAFAIAMAVANLAAAMIMIMVVTSKWYANKVAGMTKNMMGDIDKMYE